MTVDRLIKELQKVRSKHGNITVAVDWESFDCSNGVFAIVPIGAVEVDWVRRVDGDGFGMFTSKGIERGWTQAIMRLGRSPKAAKRT